MSTSSPRPSYVRDGIVLGAAVGLFGVTFGVLATTAGLPVAQACVMSLLVFTGASQFALVGVVGAGGSPVSALASALLLASRNGIYGLALHRTLQGRLLRRLGAAHLVIDESTAMALGQEDPEHAERAFWVAGLSVFAFWNLGTLAGALGGTALGDPAAWGLDAAFPAGFIVLAAPHVRSRDGRVAAAAGAAIALVAVPLVPAGAPIVLASLGAVVALVLRGRR
ncbi:AzlC family ABC transporter permease [Actinomarinicola tropica]|uniref:Branched-chain amino acid ABC transporter permease n=1 Tax=Actinomarinicola tropica TaxID=2789776 RepID=A0A5Q2RJX4_9ACTN|nr:AzlC family ABC transporter permease [Actinomarinicola tropica]QGG95784.1 branched-chain amino acid ABC transporter permease [Actinomarinicola tropica]